MVEINTEMKSESQEFLLTENQRKLHEAANNASDVLKGLANQDRLLILCYLSQQESNVSELEMALGIRQPTLSQQLGILRKQGLVETRREGKLIFYRIEDPKIHQLLQTLYELYCPKK